MMSEPIAILLSSFGTNIFSEVLLTTAQLAVMVNAGHSHVLRLEEAGGFASLELI